MEKRRLKICFWNVAGVMNKSEDTWEYLERFDVVGLLETWLEEGKWEKIRDKMSKEFIWNNVAAEREEKRGRAKGGILVATRRDIEGVQVRELSKRIVEVKLNHNKNKWRIFIIYCQNVEETLEKVKKKYKRRRKDI